MSLACGREVDCVSSGDMARLSHLERKVLCVEPILMSVQDSLLGLQEVFGRSSTAVNSPSAISDRYARNLRSYSADNAAYRYYARTVLNKTVTCTRLLDGLLNFRHQNISLSLANASVDDSATVRVLTTITVVYLSSMAVAVSPVTNKLPPTQR